LATILFLTDTPLSAFAGKMIPGIWIYLRSFMTPREHILREPLIQAGTFRLGEIFHGLIREGKRLQWKFVLTLMVIFHNVMSLHPALKPVQLDENSFQRKQTDSEWGDTRDHLNQVISSARADVEKFTSELDTVEREFDKWQDENIEQLKEDVANLAQWQNEKAMADSRYVLLTEKHQDIESAYNKRLAELGEKLSITLEEMSAARQEAAENKAEQQQSEREALSRIRDDYNGQLMALQNDYQNSLNELKVAEAELKSSLTNAGYNEFEQSQLDILDAAIKEASINEDAARGELRQAQQAHSKSVEFRKECSNALDKARAAFQQEEKAVNKINGLLYPGEGSLLEFLRANVDDWELSLGKVIRPELLERSDLAPEMTTDAPSDSSSFMGVKLALTELDTPDYAFTEQTLKQKLQEAELRQAAAHAAQNECEQRLAKANEEVRNAELVVTQKDNAVKSAEATRKRAQQDRDTVLSEYQQALSARKQKAKTKLEANQQSQKQAKAQFELSRDEIKDQQREAETEHKFHWQQLISDSEARISKADSDMRKAKDNAAQDRKDMQDWLESELNNRGVDVDEIGQLNQAFFRMYQSRNKRLGELSLLLAVSHEVSTNMDINRGMRAILRGALRGTGGLARARLC